MGTFTQTDTSFVQKGTEVEDDFGTPKMSFAQKEGDNFNESEIGMSIDSNSVVKRSKKSISRKTRKDNEQTKACCGKQDCSIF